MKEQRFDHKKHIAGVFSKSFHTSYETPSLVPASQGYKSSTLDSTHVQSFWHNSNAEMPTNQSGDGLIADTNDTR